MMNGGLKVKGELKPKQDQNPRGKMLNSIALYLVSEEHIEMCKALFLYPW